MGRIVFNINKLLVASRRVKSNNRMAAAIYYSFIFIIFQIITSLVSSSAEDMLYSKPLNKILISHICSLDLAFTLIKLYPICKLKSIGDFSKEIFLIFLIILIFHQGIEFLNRPFNNTLIVLTTSIDVTFKLIIKQLYLIDLTAVTRDSFSNHPLSLPLKRA